MNKQSKMPAPQTSTTTTIKRYELCREDILGLLRHTDLELPTPISQLEIFFEPTSNCDRGDEVHLNNIPDTRERITLSVRVSTVEKIEGSLWVS